MLLIHKKQIEAFQGISTDIYLGHVQLHEFISIIVTSPIREKMIHLAAPQVIHNRKLRIFYQGQIEIMCFSKCRELARSVMGHT